MSEPILRTLKCGKDTIHYEVVFSSRKTLQITVHRDQRVVVKAPRIISMVSIENNLKKRSRWIQKKMDYFKKYKLEIVDQKYVDGENHLYLGCQYPLKIESSDMNNVELKNGFFIIKTHQKISEHIQKLMMSWYRVRAEFVFQEIFESCWQKFKKKGMKKPSLKLRKMKRRWGSLSRSGKLTLNIQLIKASKVCIEFVVYHELCHIVHFNHGKGFYELFDRTMPDWREHKNVLDSSGIC